MKQRTKLKMLNRGLSPQKLSGICGWSKTLNRSIMNDETLIILTVTAQIALLAFLYAQNRKKKQADREYIKAMKNAADKYFKRINSTQK